MQGNRQPSKLIEVRLRSASQLFNSMDPSPFHEKDLDRTAEEFITGWALEYPLEQPLVLAVHLETAAVDIDPQSIVRDAVHHFFGYRAEVKRRELRELMRRGRASLAIGLMFLAACLLTGRFVATFSDDAMSSIVRESLLICGWVAMWRPLQIFLYDWWPIRYMRRLYMKMSTMEVRVVIGAE